MHSQRISLTVLITLVTANVSTVPVKLPVRLSSPQVLAQTTDTSAQVQNTQDRRQEALRRRLFDTGKQQYRKGQFRSALKTFRQVLVIVRTIGERQDEAKISNYIGLVYHNLGQDIKALQFYQQGLAIYQEVGDRQGVGTTLGNIGKSYQGLGQYAKALNFYQQGLAISQEVGDRQGVGTTLGKIGGMYIFLAQYSKALNFLQQSLAISREVGDRYSEAAALSTIGEVYTRLGQYPKALDFLHQGEVISREVGDRSLVAGIFLSMGVVYKNLGQYSKALNFYQQVLAIARELGQRRTEGAAFHEIGTVYKHLGQYPKALDFYQQVLAITREEEDPPAEALTLTSIGSTFLQTGKTAAAEKTLLAAIKIWESLRPGLTDVYKVSIFETQAKTYRYLEEALIAQKKTDAALEIAERSRARAFVELLARQLSSNKAAQMMIAPPTIGQIKQIAREQNATFVEYSIVSDALDIWIVKPTGEVAFQSAYFNVDLPNVAEGARVAAATTAEGRKLADVAILNFVRGTRSAVEMTGDNASNEQVAVRAYSPHCKGNRCLQQMYKLLIKPIADLLPTDPESRVIFIPHQSLFLIPFAALQDEEGKYLIEKHTIITAPSIQLLDLTHKRERLLLQAAPQNAVRVGILRKALVVGNPKMPNVPPRIGAMPSPLPPLPGAEAEALAIAAVLKTQAITGNRATKAAIVQQMAKARIIHLATHGLLDDLGGTGVPGAIALAPKGTDNGLLTSNEILNLKLNASLVVLSACDTGRGRITGDGVIGLSRAFISAGTPSIVVSLWRVSDESTAFLMTEFYRQLLSSNSDKARSLRGAILATMKQYPNPRDWAAFTLMGEAK